MKSETQTEAKEYNGVSVLICDQGDLCAARYALYLAAEDEKDPDKKAALERVGNALHEITNHFGTDAIASSDVFGEYREEQSQ
jgi:hypothetical protein